MSPEIYLAIGFVPTLFLLIFLLIRSSRASRQQTQVTGPVVPAGASAGIEAIARVDESAFMLLSQRLAAVEGRLGPIAASLDAVAVLNQRVAAMEANMPSVQQAMEHYSDAINRADKRDTERARRTKKTSQDSQTAGEAAADLMGAPGAGGETPPLTQPGASTNNGDKPPMAGLYGSGGRNR